MAQAQQVRASRRFSSREMVDCETVPVSAARREFTTESSAARGMPLAPDCGDFDSILASPRPLDKCRAPVASRFVLAIGEGRLPSGDLQSRSEPRGLPYQISRRVGMGEPLLEFHARGQGAVALTGLGG